MENVDTLLADFVQQFEESEDATRDSREKAERDRDYYDEKQWTAAEKDKLKARGQPDVTYNRIKRKVNAMQGLEKQTRKDPKAFPRTPQDEAAAHAATDVLRYVCDDSRWDDKRSEASKELAVEGTCAIMVGVKQVKEGIDPDVRHIRWDRFYHDPHSADFDFADAAYMGVVIWSDLDKVVAKYPEAKDVLEATWIAARDSETYDDRPKHSLWADYRRKRVRLCEHYALTAEGWTFCIFTKGGFVVEPMASPYLDDEGKPECPIKAVSLYVDRDNNRYGEVRTMIGAQDEINHRRSRALWASNARQVRVSNNVGKDAKEIARELAKPNGVLVAEAGEVEILQNNDFAENLQLLQEAKAEIDLQGPNAALGGKNERDMSGRAILAQQQGGMTELATYLDRIKTLSLSVYRSIWARVRQHWNGERWIRITDNENNMKFVGINQPVTMVQKAAEQFGVTKENMGQADPQIMAQLQALANDPRGQQVVSVENNLAELDVDITIDEGIDTPTIAAEEFQSLVQLAGTGTVVIPPDVLIEASSLRNKERLLEMMKQGPSPEEQQMQQQAVQIKMAGEAAKVAKTESETAENYAQIENMGAKTQLEALGAGMQQGMAG